ncbi:aminotransferase class V-fold PLP-dependent enzyme [Clostridium tyrobutyricum]|jgi:aspartate aminotransferase-like enzyme|uniref:Serine--pyruvate aminotransferase n=1 Tax=Clostridium tyrobutyricum DIVETGP TaxID=1408889 RepID=W6N3Z8_CLOTY|nr:alanine--glyoxylate aminotransferase family protein [Clostridium tyrobutyricum]AND83306.1 aminotransferase [Clostridium tyrobutyricum]ANP70820.1 aminotransferase [Clostridium tyrobutyricum]MBR9648301.1 alanine--glyoxylate aminotransferase family protein [Clostridium tyrobutyricum]MBV4426381.1 alanine--glyoxylate aminotransferase family protein [Clostridium tyrobutyricum]MBV4429095.1 alanine--glyoxylate aminotransferase family protein [Clostridium tyrobutyricum]
MHKKLFIPGPVEVRKDVLEKMATPMIGHRSKEASQLQRGISDKLRKLFYTNEEILLSTSSGTGLLEGAIRCSTVKRAAIFSVGAFGKRWYQIAEANNVPADLFEEDFGKAVDVDRIDKALATGKYDVLCITHNETSTGVMNPVEEISKVIKKYPEVVWCVDTVSSMAGTKIEVDKLGIDICLTSTQKAIGLPPGMSICSFSKKAVERAKKVKFRGYYLDLLSLYNYIHKKDYQYPSTPSLSHMFALDYQLDRILEEGLENRYKRHLDMAEYVRAWARKYFELYSDERYLSNTVTNIKNTRNIDIGELNKELGKRGFQISNGYGTLKGKAFRIAHMADFTLDDIKELINNINDILKL